VTTPELPPATRRWLDQPALSRLWTETHRRLRRNGRQPAGRLRLPATDSAEREALSLLLGRSFPASDITINLADLDTALRTSAAQAGLIDVVTALHGQIPDDRGQRHAHVAAWTATWDTVTACLQHAGLTGSAWAPRWLAEIRAAGSVSRLGAPDAERLLRQGIAVLAALTAGDAPPRGRAELAERYTGTAHGLDDDTVLARLVLRGLSYARDQDFPTNPRTRRELWEAFRIQPDAVSTTVLVYALTPTDDHWLADHLRQRTTHHAEAQLSLRDVRRLNWQLAPGTTVYVCENPRVVEAAADAGCRHPMVCTSGNPTHTVLTLLDALTREGATLAYRGDFDWPGIAIANRVMHDYQARPWRMTAADYEQHVADARSRDTPLQPLSGPPVPAAWDAELTATMHTIGLAVHEESALELLLRDLAG
jgi:uncharacterized protein (TIGR02679 family)